MSLFCLAESLLALAMLSVHPASLAASFAPSFIWVKKTAVWLICVMPMLHLPPADAVAPPPLLQAARVRLASTSTTVLRLNHRLFPCMATPSSPLRVVKVFPHVRIAWVTGAQVSITETNFFSAEADVAARR